MPPVERIIVVPGRIASVVTREPGRRPGGP